jgi:hypothetical protein
MKNGWTCNAQSKRLGREQDGGPDHQASHTLQGWVLWPDQFIPENPNTSPVRNGRNGNEYSFYCIVQDVLGKEGDGSEGNPNRGTQERGRDEVIRKEVYIL